MKRIGIVGGGQLGRMIAPPAQQLGFEVAVLDPTPHSPAAQVTEHHIQASFDDAAAIRRLGEMSDYLTFEIELAHDEVLNELTEQGVQVNPSAATLGLIKDKLSQKEFLAKAGLPVTNFRAVTGAANVREVAKEFGYPLLLKARRDAYDGRGNVLIEAPEEIAEALERLNGRELYVEQFVPFAHELAVMVARDARGTIVTYPTVETVHRNNICHLVRAPAPIAPRVAKQATALAHRVMEQFKGAGVFGVEMFLTENGEILINEIAPRVHNSGHYTIEACPVSQFEQHVRAITGLPLGSTGMFVPAAVMVNILGERQGPAQLTGLEEAVALSGVSVHIYGKADTKPDRKMGHITAVGNTLETAETSALKARELITI